MNTESFTPPVEGGEDEEQVRTPKQIAERIDELDKEIARLKELSSASKENIDVPLGSEEYVDHGYMAQARELEMERDNLQTKLIEMGNAGDKGAVEAAQRDLL